ncbi:MAG: hypothetical protein KF791_16475 [Verrucomicrobiae bacterium]|nr:hypothetical protein [Verrucomicrobiae bacterium]
MAYALLQTELSRPDVRALERAFASGRGLTLADARFVADDAFGILARDLSLEDALFLQQSLGAEGIEIEVAPESDLPRLPEPRLFDFAACTPEHLVLYDPLGRPTDVPWDQVTVVAAGFDQRQLKIEIIVGDAETRYQSTLDRLQFDRMPAYIDDSEPDNRGESFRKLVRDVVLHCDGAHVNQAARLLAGGNLEGDVTRDITYPRPMAYTEELVWLLWRARAGHEP